MTATTVAYALSLHDALPIFDNKHQDRAAEWFGFTSFQEWSRPQHEWMLRQREAQQRTGRIIPQTNEEYGYEDHYPRWAQRSEEHTSELQSHVNLVCRLLLET